MSAAPLRFPHENPPEPGTTVEIAPGVVWLRMPLPMRLDHINCFALDDGDGWTIVDTGFDTKKARAIWQTTIDGPLGGRPINRVVVTHHHPDHVGLAGWFQAAHGAELVTTRTAWLYARMLTLEVQETPPAEQLEFWRSAGMDAEVYAKRMAERPFNMADIVTPLPLGYRRIVEGGQIEMGGRTWDIRMGNGHAPEHATFWSTDGELVLAGDQMLASISPNLGVHAAEPDADPVGDWLEACERLSGFATDDQLVLPGHKLPFTGLPLRMRQLIDNHHTALDRLLAALSEPLTAADCFQPLYKRRIGDGEYGLALVEAVGHVNHLYQLGKISRTRRDDGA